MAQYIDFQMHVEFYLTDQLGEPFSIFKVWLSQTFTIIVNTIIPQFLQIQVSNERQIVHASLSKQSSIKYEFLYYLAWSKF